MTAETTLGEVRRRIGATRAVRALTDLRPVARLLSLLTYSRLTTTPLRFAWRELAPGSRRAAYRLRRGGTAVTMRHRSPDLFTFDQVFHEGHLEPPPEAAAALARAAGPLTIVDLGANIGMFGAYALQRFAVERMTAFEPDPQNVAILRETVGANGRGDDWRVVEACAGVAQGTVPFSPDAFGRSRIAGAGAPGTIEVSVQDAFPYMGEADLVKIDVEGAEWELLADPRFSRLTAVVCLEYHPDGCPTAEPCQAARAALEGAGFRVAPGTDAGARTGMLWAWKTG